MSKLNLSLLYNLGKLSTFQCKQLNKKRTNYMCYCAKQESHGMEQIQLVRFTCSQPPKQEGILPRESLREPQQIQIYLESKRNTTPQHTNTTNKPQLPTTFISPSR